MKNTATPHQRIVNSFKSLAKDYYDETFERFPISGGGAGIKRFHPLLGRGAPAVHEAQGKLARRTLTAIEKMPVHAFEGNDWLDRMTLRSNLRQEILKLDNLKTWQTNPQRPLDQIGDAIYSLIVRHADDLRPVAPALVSRLRAIPRYLDEACDCIASPVPLWTKLTAQTAGGIGSLLHSLPEQLEKVTREDPRDLKRWTKEAERAVKTYVRRVERLKPGEERGYSLGRERFESLLVDRTGLNLTANEAVASALGLIESLKAELKTEARRFHPRKSASEILEEAAAHWKPEGRSLLSAYRRQTTDVKNHFRRAGAMTFPRGERLIVKLVPDFMIHQFPTAAYSAPGPLDPDQTGIFWVNDLSLKVKGADAKQAEIAQHFGLELTSAHEAYPGHHLQFAIQNRHPSLVRKFADHAIYYEGWTLWCEQMSVDFKISKNPYLRLQQLQDALWRANRIVIDCGLQTGELSYDGAVRRLVREVGFTKARGQGDVNWYTSSPTIPMSYLLGKMELLRLKRQRVDRGGWTLKRFNDWILSFGAIPWTWIEASGL